MKRLAFLASGSGTNFENLVREIRAGRIPAEATLLVCDEPQAKAMDRAKKLGVEVALVVRKDFPSKETFEAEMIRRLEAAQIDLIVLAGFMRILGSEFVRRYSGRIINIHPAFLPAFPGAHGIRDAFEAKVKETGVTVHYVDQGVDTGPVILQEKVLISPTDTLATLEAKIHAVEYRLYPEALRQILAGKF